MNILKILNTSMLNFVGRYEVNEEQMRSFVMMPYSGIVIEGSNSNE